METERKVEMIRLERPEEVYDREEIFGREVSSVFPKAAQEAAGGSGPNLEALKESLGARKFISESELETIKQTRGGSLEDGSISRDKSLAQILQDNKDRKNEAFQEMWKQMKTGKNRPLDADELEFYDNLVTQEREADAAWSNLERSEMEEFRQALQASAAASKPDGLELDAVGDRQPSQSKPKPAVAAKAPAPKAIPVFKPIVKVKAKEGAPVAGAKRPAASDPVTGDSKQARKGESAAEEAMPKAASDEDEDGGGGLTGLLGAYDSGDDSD